MGDIFQLEREVACKCTAFAEMVHNFSQTTDVKRPIGTSPLRHCRKLLMVIRDMSLPDLLRLQNVCNRRGSVAYTCRAAYTGARLKRLAASFHVQRSIFRETSQQ
jgi:hypothetical protein